MAFLVQPKQKKEVGLHKTHPGCSQLALPIVSEEFDLSRNCDQRSRDGKSSRKSEMKCSVGSTKVEGRTSEEEG